MTDSKLPVPAASRRRDRRINGGAARHSTRAGSPAWLFVTKVLAATLAVILVSGFSVGATTLWNFQTDVQNNAIDITDPEDTTPPQIGTITGAFNILVVGVDNDADQAEAYGERDATLNDVNILLHVSADHTTATVVSIPRDLITAQPACTNATTGATASAVSAAAFNSAFGRGGLSCVVSTAAQLTGLEIDYAAQMSFNAVVQMTDAVGGVPVCLTEPIKDDYSGLDLEAGITEISGTQALSFLRSRHGVGDGSDLARISSQQVYLSALLRQLKSEETLTDFATLYRLANVATNNVRLSTSLTSLDTMVSMAQSLNTVDLSTMALVQYPGTTGDARYPGKVVPTVSLADKLFDAIRADTPIALADDSFGSGSTLDPNAVVETPAPVDTAVPSETPAPGETPVPTETAMAGIVGQTADQQTCSVAFGG